MELLLNAIDLVPHGFRLLVIQLRRGGARQSPLRAVHNRSERSSITAAASPIGHTTASTVSRLSCSSAAIRL
jgi:hypothetical protein